EAVRGVEHSHAAAQSVLGPLLERRCAEEWDEVTGTGSERRVVTTRRDITLRQVPSRLAVDGRTRSDPLWRGLFKVNAWTGHFTIAADFATLAALLPRAEHSEGRLR